MEHILKSWGHTFRFIIVFLLLFIAIAFVINRINDKTEFNIDYSNDKTLVTIIDKKNIIANSVLPACDCWTNTGIEIRPGEEFEIKVSGKIHTTADKLIKDAADDVKPRFDWIGPDGGSFLIRENLRYHKSDSIRRTLLLNSNAKIGQVLFYLQRKNTLKPNCAIGQGYFNPDSVIIYDPEKGISGKNDGSETFFIWATVNDMLIKDFDTESNQAAYLGGALEDTLSIKKEQWKELRKENYNRIWFDDNIGNFVVSAKILKPISFWGF